MTYVKYGKNLGNHSTLSVFYASFIRLLSLFYRNQKLADNLTGNPSGEDPIPGKMPFRKGGFRHQIRFYKNKSINLVD